MVMTVTRTSAPVIAARVPKPADLVAAEVRLQALRDEVETWRCEYRANAQQLDRGRSLTEKQRAQIETRQHELNEKINNSASPTGKLITIITRLRPQHFNAVKAALASVRSDTAHRVLNAISELSAAADALNAAHVEIERAGGSAQALMRPIYLDATAATARLIVAETDQKEMK